MIATMKKITFLAFHKDYDRFLTDLRELGLIHVAETDKTAEESERLTEQVARYKELRKSQRILKKSIDKKSPPAFNKPDLNIGEAIPDKIHEIQDKRAVLCQQLQESVKVRDALMPWGNFEPEDILRLQRAGTCIHFFIVPANRYKTEWEERYNAIVITTEHSKTYFVTITKDNKVVDELGLETLKLPEVSLTQVNTLVVDLYKKIEAEDEKLKALVVHLPSVELAIKEIEQSISFTKVVQSTTSLADDKLMLLQGWVPADNLEEVTRYLASKDAYYEVSNPTPEDDVPIQFKNNRFFRLFEPITEIYSLPKYNELDLTPYFAPFYMVFFGLSLGDIGYGLFFLVVATLIKWVKKSSLSDTFKSILSLVQVLGASGFACGLLTGGFFGFHIYTIDHPIVQALRDKVYFNNTQMFYLSLVLGLIQVMFGKCLQAVNRTKQFGFVYALTTIGWIVLISSFVFSLLFPQVLPMLGTAHWIILILSMIAIFLLNSPGKNIFMNLGLGVWDTYNTVTGLLGDVLSYIRLFALGLSGGILATVFNSLATGMSPDKAIIGPIVTVIIFLIGHGITIFMSALGAFVHPLRLTFVEFYRSAGFEGGGKKYTPFKRIKNEERSTGN